MTGFQKIIKIFAIFLAGFIIVNIVGSIIFAISVVTNITAGPSRSTKNFSKTYQNIQNLEVDLSTSNLTIKEGRSWEVKASKVSKMFTVEKDNNTLKIKEKTVWPFNHFKSGEVTVYIPKTELNKLDIEGGVGKIEIKNTISKDLNLQAGVGYLKIDNSIFYNTDIETGVGKAIVTSSTLNNLEMEGGVGSIDIEANITGISKIECGVGEINISLLGKKEDYTITAEKGLGEIKIENQSQKNKIVYGTGKNNIKLEGGVGTIDLRFANNTYLENN